MRNLLTVLFAAVLTAAIAGCSTDNGFTVASDNTSTVLSYLPVESGYSVYYDVAHSDGRSEVVRFSVGEATQIGSESASEWIYTSTSGEEKVSFIKASGDAIFIYDPSAGSTEKILQLPLEPGESWDRYSAGSGSEGGNTNDGGGGFDYVFVNGDSSSTPGGAGGSNETNKEYTNDEALGSYPTDGALKMLVDDIETIELKSGTVYSKAVRISNAGSSGRTNYYWYVQGIGLVKYAINAQGPNDGSGQLVGELLSFSR